MIICCLSKNYKLIRKYVMCVVFALLNVVTPQVKSKVSDVELPKYFWFNNKSHNKSGTTKDIFGFKIKVTLKTKFSLYSYRCCVWNMPPQKNSEFFCKTWHNIRSNSKLLEPILLIKKSCFLKKGSFLWKQTFFKVVMLFFWEFKFFHVNFFGESNSST